MIAGDGLTKCYGDVAVVDDITSKSRGCSAYSGAMARGRRQLPGLARPARSRLRSSVNRRLRLLASDPQPFAVAVHNVQFRTRQTSPRAGQDPDQNGGYSRGREYLD